jgi:Flp pilus assembly protein TadG
VPDIRRAITRTKGEASQALAEFALVLPVLLVLIFGVIEGAALFRAWVTVQHAAQVGGRYAVTGQLYDGEPGGSGLEREYAIVSKARNAANPLPIDDAAGPNDPRYLKVGVRSSSSSPDPDELNAGGPQEFVVVSVEYNYEALTPLMRTIIPSIKLTGRSQMINERFSRPTLRLGEIPPTPVPTWTPTYTPTPIATDTPTPTPSITPTPTVSPTPTASPIPSETPTPTETLIPGTPTTTSVPTNTPVPTKTPVPTNTSVPPSPTPTEVPWWCYWFPWLCW